MRHVIIAIIAAVLLPFATPSAASAGDLSALKAELAENRTELAQGWKAVHAARTALHAFMEDDARTAHGGAEALDALQAELDAAVAVVQELRADKAVLARQIKMQRGAAGETQVAAK